MNLRSLSMSWTIVALLMCAEAAVAAEHVDYNRDIKPILSNNCIICHGPDAAARKAGLRLDTAAGATASRQGHPAISPGDPDSSGLIDRISRDDKRRMPPPSSGKSLSAENIATLRSWIEQGANYDMHWSYQPVHRPQPPQVADAAWSHNAIDRFVATKLRSHGLQPTDRADRITLARRVSLDLTGLPPTLDEIDAFVADDRPDAYERLVDDLLARPSYGERWASVWLDLARYADSAGYADDRSREIWAYRDYVIRSLNENKPFDAFTIEQIAGDLVSDPTEEQRIATAFHRNTLTNSEGGTDDEEFRNVAVVDRVNTTMSVWMGATMACAQCHDHKYDPLKQREYFQLFDVFNQSADSDKPDEQPLLSLYSDDQQKQRARLETELAQLKSSPNDEPDIATQQRAWERRITADADKSIQARFVRITIPDREEYLALAEVEVLTDGENLASSGTATQSSIAFGGAAARAIDGVTDGDFHAANSTSHTKKDLSPWWELDLGHMAIVDRLTVYGRTDGSTGDRLHDYQVVLLNAARDIVWTQRTVDPPQPSTQFVIAGPPQHIVQVAAKPVTDRTKAEQSELRAYFMQSGQYTTSPRQQRIVQINNQLQKITPTTTVPVMQQLPPAEHRDTHIHLRGSFQSLGEQVHGGMPAVFPAPKATGPIDRLQLAHWLVSPDNPLTARVTVNRYWEKLFGAGLVLTSEDFGSQGDLPTHPELLDWLAAEFMDNGWNVKYLLRLIVTSQTYQQSSVADAERLRLDPDNQWLCRGPRVRATAEMVRDQSLAVSGLLSSKMYGPPVQPPRPKSGLKAAFGKTTDWTDSAGPDRYRRALYTEWRRSQPYPSMATFDAPSREVCEIRRSRTNTPLQALVTLNDPVYVEAAQALARRMAHETPSADDDAVLTHGFRLCLSRHPSPAELSTLRRLYQQTFDHYRDETASAVELATNPLGPLPEGADAAQLAALTVVSNVLLNMDEMLQKR